MLSISERLGSASRGIASTVAAVAIMSVILVGVVALYGGVGRQPIGGALAPSTPNAAESLEESDAFWGYWVDEPRGFVVFEGESLEHNVQQSHLVVRGHITNLYVGEYWQVLDDGAPRTPIAYVTVAVSEVLKGDPVSRTPGFVEVGLGSVSPEFVEEFKESFPRHDNIWFLMKDLELSPRPPNNEAEIAEFAYLPTNDLQGVLRNIGGQVKITKPEWTAENTEGVHFPLPLQDTSFDALVDQMRLIAADVNAPRP